MAGKAKSPKASPKMKAKSPKPSPRMKAKQSKEVISVEKIEEMVEVKSRYAASLFHRYAADRECLQHRSGCLGARYQADA